MSCENNKHMFSEPVVVTTTSESTTWIVGRDKITKEAAVVFCRRCGYRVAYGWGLKGDEG